MNNKNKPAYYIQLSERRELLFATSLTLSFVTNAIYLL